MTIKEDLHRLVDELPKKELPVAKRYLEYLRNMGDPVLRSFMEAPEDDEEETEEETAMRLRRPGRNTSVARPALGKRYGKNWPASSRLCGGGLSSRLVPSAI